MTSRRPGERRPIERRAPRPTFPTALLAFALASMVALVAACGGASDLPTARPATEAPSVSDGPAPSDVGTDEPTGTGPASEAPSASPSPSSEPSASASAAPSDDPGTSGEPGQPGDLAACAGTDANREFYASVAAAVDWPVFCPVLGSGWFVESGTYALAGGGRMEIAYRGPGGSSLDLRQGTVCADGACAASGADLGETAYGSLIGTLSDGGDGSFIVTVDADTSPSWVLASDGLSETEVRRVAADLIQVPPAD